jgi:23S rRNA-/tRNA-specific pseudouridylate synthase
MCVLVPHGPLHYLTDLKRYALESGVTTVNGKIAKPETIIKNGDRIEWVSCCPFSLHLTFSRNIVHRHEPPVTSTPIKVLHHDVEREFIVVDKPGSIVRSSFSTSSSHLTSLQPVHPVGRYFNNTLLEILEHEFGYKTYRTQSIRSCSRLIDLRTSCQQTRPTDVGSHDIAALIPVRQDHGPRV